MTCTTCGAILDSTATACPVCAAPAPASPDASASMAGAHAAPAGVAVTAATVPPGEPSWGAPPPQPQPPHRSGLPSDVRGWGIGAHLAGLGAALLTATIFGFVGPLMIWLLKRDEHPFVDHHAKEALNFQLTVLVALVGGALLAIPAAIIGVLTLGLGLVLFAGIALAAVVAWFVLPIVGAVKAADGSGYRYPFTIRFVR